MIDGLMDKWRDGLAKTSADTWAGIEQMIAAKVIDPRYNMRRPLDPVLEAMLPELEHPRPYYVLDVACGYLTQLGRVTSKGAPIQIVGVDILASEYQRMAHSKRLPVTHPMIVLAAEELSAVFPPGTFDLVVCSDALDGLLNPPEAVSEMIKLVRPGGSVVVEVGLNRGKTAGYADGRYWDADLKGDMLVMTDENGTAYICSRYHGVTLHARILDDTGTIRAVARKPLGGLITRSVIGS